MRDRYDFSKSTPNPYAKRMKQQITIRLDQDTVSYFKAMAEEKGIPYQRGIISKSTPHRLHEAHAALAARLAGCPVCHRTSHTFDLE